MVLRRTVTSLVVGVWTLLGASGVELQPAKAETLWETTNSRLAVGEGGVYRWQLAPGQMAQLAIRQDHDLLQQLRGFDYLTFEMRVASGEISGAELNMLGHVSGARQYKVHNWQVAVLTTEKQVWHRRCYELARPNWLPWDKADGEGVERYLRFSAIGLVPGTVIELRGLTLSRGLIRLKPDFIAPVTWPVLSRNEAGEAVYTLTHQVINQGNRPLTIEAEVVSDHEAYEVSIEPAVAEQVANGKTATFTIEARLPTAREAELEELAAERLTLTFRPRGEPQATIWWSGELVRPLSDQVRRQVLLPEEDLALLRESLSGDQRLAALVKPEAALEGAKAFLEKELLSLPTGNLHVRNNWIGDWRPGARMPEAVNMKTGETQFGTVLASRTWKEYLGHRGKALDHLAEAYLYTGDEIYAEKAIALFRLYAQQYTELHWGDLFSPAWSQGEAMLASSRVAGSSTYGTNWYFKGHCRLMSAIAESPAWKPAVREEVYQGFVLPYATELMKFDGGISNMTDISNHNVLLLGLAFGDAGLVRWALYSDPGLVRRLEDIDPDGFSSEGRPLNYHHAAMAEYLPALSYLHNSGLAVKVPTERLAEAIRMPFQRANLAGYVPSSGDSGRGYRVQRRREADWLIRMFPEQEWLYDLGSLSTIQAQLQAYRREREPDPQAWQALLETEPRLYGHAGLVILRSGEAPEQQIMATLDFGRNPMHAHLDRNTISLSAFGQLYSQGPGSLYNIGKGGMTRNPDARLDRFVSSGSLGQNVILVDLLDQEPAVGELLRWEATAERQLAVARVPAIRPGVSHVRALALVDGLVIVLDRVTSEAEHTYDMVYHNFGELSLGAGWSAREVSEPLGETANYQHLVEPRALSGEGPVHLSWTVTEEAKLALWQVGGEEVFSAITALNNIQTGQMPQPTPTLISRVRGKTATWLTVLEPYRELPRVRGIEGWGTDGIRVLLEGREPLELRVPELGE